MDTIAMIKKNKTKYLYEGQSLNIKQIHSKNRKRRGRSKYLLSVDVTLKTDGETLPARIACVRNKSNRKDWLALISTDTNLSNVHVAIVFTRYMILSVAKRRNGDDKTIRELFYRLMDELDDITFSQSMQIILEALLDTVMGFFISQKRSWKNSLPVLITVFQNTCKIHCMGLKWLSKSYFVR